MNNSCPEKTEIEDKLKANVKQGVTTLMDVINDGLIHVYGKTPIDEAAADACVTGGTSIITHEVMPVVNRLYQEKVTTQQKLDLLINNVQTACLGRLYHETDNLGRCVHNCLRCSITKAINEAWDPTKIPEKEKQHNNSSIKI